MSAQTIDASQTILFGLLENERTRSERLLIALVQIREMSRNNPEIQSVIEQAINAQLATSAPDLEHYFLNALRGSLDSLKHENLEYSMSPDMKDEDSLRALTQLSAESLRKVWDTPEEDEAWQYLQPAT